MTFTGSTAVGKRVGHAAVDHMARFSLELGGKNLMQVLANADLDKAVAGALMPGLLNQETVAREEVFGPVLSVMPFDEVEEGLAMVNDSDLGLTMRLIPRIEAGTVWVNTHVTLDASLPFGGVKQSGIGREFGREAVEACTELKSVCIAY